MIGKGLLWAAARRIVQNPEVQQRATDIAAEVYTRAKPKLDNAGRQISESMRDAAAEHDPIQDPVGFVKSLKNKALPPEDRS
ncbi:hypothetical protein [Nisaea nitritireducens]|uniref:hypothetical protein n=1 Tax=Nisaea nitritireducens TaxID=568392 RepID=UPI0018679FE2|nr:hypothetical protein [Nisaea nitritireducens]